jgi:hypothetical protein
MLAQGSRVRTPLWLGTASRDTSSQIVIVWLITTAISTLISRIALPARWMC